VLFIGIIFHRKDIESLWDGMPGIKWLQRFGYLPANQIPLPNIEKFLPRNLIFCKAEDSISPAQISSRFSMPSFFTMGFQIFFGIQLGAFFGFFT
jgi:hypothetical protein